MLGGSRPGPVNRHGFEIAGSAGARLAPIMGPAPAGWSLGGWRPAGPLPSSPCRALVPAAPAPPESFSKIVLASLGEFPYSTSSHGGVAQLGERLTGSQEVRGSIPLVSTRALNEAPTQVGAFFHIGTQGQRRHHDPPGRQDRALNGCRAHGSISHRGSKCWRLFCHPNCKCHFIRALGATVSAGDS